MQTYRHRISSVSSMPGNIIIDFCNIYNLSTRPHFSRDFAFDYLLSTTQMRTIKPKHQNVRLRGIVFFTEQIIRTNILDRPIRAIFRRLGTRATYNQTSTLPFDRVGVLAISGLIESKGERLPIKPKSIFISYSHGCWYLCISTYKSMIAYRISKLTLSYRCI